MKKRKDIHKVGVGDTYFPDIFNNPKKKYF
jgi:hypothetical protein